MIRVKIITSLISVLIIKKKKISEIFLPGVTVQWFVSEEYRQLSV